MTTTDTLLYAMATEIAKLKEEYESLLKRIVSSAQDTLDNATVRRLYYDTSAEGLAIYASRLGVVAGRLRATEQAYDEVKDRS